MLTKAKLWGVFWALCDDVFQYIPAFDFCLFSKHQSLYRLTMYCMFGDPFIIRLFAANFRWRIRTEMENVKQHNILVNFLFLINRLIPLHKLLCDKHTYFK